MKKQNMQNPGLQKHAHAQAVNPPPQVWDNIATALHKEKTKGLFWWVATGFVGLFLIAFFIWGFLYLQGDHLQVQSEFAGKMQTVNIADKQKLKTNAATLLAENTMESISSADAASESAEATFPQTERAANPDLQTGSFQAASKSPKTSIKNKKEEPLIPAKKDQIAPEADENVIASEIEQKNSFTDNAFIATKLLNLRSSYLDFPDNAEHVNRSIVIAETKSSAIPPNWRKGVQCFDFSSASQPVYYADVFGGAGVLQKNMHSLETEFDAYRNLRDSTELSWYSANGGMRVGIIRGGFTADIGIRYRQINEIFTGTRENEEQTTINTIRDEEGNIIATDTIIQYGSRTRETGNAFRHFEIPLRLGYMVGNRNWSAGINVGATYVFSNRRKGLIYGTGGSFYNIGTDEAGYYHNHGFWRASASVFLLYHIREQVGIFIEPEVIFDLQSLSSPEYPLTTKYNQYSMQVGLRYFFQ